MFVGLIQVAAVAGVKEDTLRKRVIRAAKAGKEAVFVEGYGTLPFKLEENKYFIHLPDDPEPDEDTVLALREEEMSADAFQVYQAMMGVLLMQTAAVAKAEGRVESLEGENAFLRSLLMEREAHQSAPASLPAPPTNSALLSRIWGGIVMLFTRGDGTHGQDHAPGRPREGARTGYYDRDDSQGEYP